ncbi:MAG TPA: hypothetical protein VFM70_07570 [Salinimicrobium sp.]|nr:hypothetical protein [Salinimicrobium sp.]
MENDFLQLFFYLLPAIVVGLVSYYFFSLHTSNEEKRRRFILHKENQKQSLPLRLQAYERLSLFLERISPGNLLLRVNPVSSNKEDYERLLIRHIEQEFEHNLAQQIYVSDQCWNAVRASKNATISIIRRTNMSDKIENSNKLREVILTDLFDNHPPSETGLAFVKKEVRELF